MTFICARPLVWKATAGRILATSKCRIIAGGFFLPSRRRRAPSRSATTKGNRRGRKYRVSIAVRCAVSSSPRAIRNRPRLEQQRHLGATCPSLYDLRNLYQINVEEGRHLWAMVYLLHAYFWPRWPGRGGRDAAAAFGGP